ncbi:MAG: FkbM family methyltransferase [Rickettsiales bacterium]|nr:MAG: FkbM family methyltransferase [Rickettsiales bacterium]
MLQLVPKDYISGQIIFNKNYEPISLNLAIELLSNSDGVFVDVGANLGLYSSIILKAFGEKRIIAIEPEVNNFIMLNNNIALNTLDQNKITTLNIAIGATSKLIELESPVVNNNGTFRVVINSSNTDITKKYYPMMALDTVFKSLNIKNISLMKIDIEGYEMEALKGIDWDSEYKPQNILMEFSDYVSRTGTSAQEILQYLIEKGYQPYSVDKVPYSTSHKLPEDNLLFTLNK